MTNRNMYNKSEESDYSKQTVGPRELRTGYTTGSTAAAAAKAAVMRLLSGDEVPTVLIDLPIGQSAELTIHRYDIIDSEHVLCSVIKDGGDDPDATHGAEICVKVSRDHTRSGVTITRGEGVGLVTRPGTGIDVGEPAVTRVPRRMIVESIQQAAVSQGFDPETGFIVEISVPGGEEIALKTTNSRQGV